MMQFNIGPTDRVSIMGRTGTGKTYFAKKLLTSYLEAVQKLGYYVPIIILDMKGTKKTFEGFGKRITKLKLLRWELLNKTPIIVYSPSDDEQNISYYNGFFKYLYALNKPMLVYVDEFALLGKGENIPDTVKKFYKQGRERGQAFWAATQTPVFIASDFLANAEHYFVFDLRRKADREKVSEDAGMDEIRKSRPPDPHGFWYLGAADQDPAYFNNIETDKVGGSHSKEPEKTHLIKKEETVNMKGKYVISLFVLGFVMLFIIPLWKNVFKFAADKVPATAKVNDFVAQA